MDVSKQNDDDDDDDDGSLGCNLHILTISVATTLLSLKLQQLSSKTLSVYHFYIQSCIK